MEKSSLIVTTFIASCIFGANFSLRITANYVARLSERPSPSPALPASLGHAAAAVTVIVAPNYSHNDGELLVFHCSA